MSRAPEGRAWLRGRLEHEIARLPTLQADADAAAAAADVLVGRVSSWGASTYFSAARAKAARVRGSEAAGELARFVADPEREGLLMAFDFELAQALKAKDVSGGRASKHTLLFPYHTKLSMGTLYSRAIRQFGSPDQAFALATDQVLTVLACRHRLPIEIVLVIRDLAFRTKFVYARLDEWDPASPTSHIPKDDKAGMIGRPVLVRGHLQLGLPGSLHLSIRCKDRIVTIEGHDPVELQKRMLAVRKVIGLPDPLDGAHPHTLVLKVEMTEWSREVFAEDDHDCSHGYIERYIAVPNNACVSELDGWLRDLHCDDYRFGYMYLNISNGLDWHKPQIQFVATIEAEICAQVCGDPVILPDRRKPYFGALRDAVAEDEQASAIANIGAQLPQALAALRGVYRRVSARLSKMNGFTDTCSEEYKNPNGGDDPSVVTNSHAWSRGSREVSQQWCPEAVDGAPIPQYRKRVHGSRAALIRYITDHELELKDDSYGIDDTGLNIVTSCALADVLPSMEETFQPAVTPFVVCRRDAPARPIPTAIVDYTKSPQFTLTVVGRSARLADAVYPKVISAARVAAAGAWWQ